MLTVLLVDDEQTELDNLLHEINWSQFGVDQVLCALDAHTALSIMERERVDLLVTDICMPQMDGLQMVEQVRARFPHVHCVLLTAHEQFDYARAAVRLGVENYLLKPLNATELEETVNRAFDNLYINRPSSEVLFAENVLLRWLHNAIDEDELFERTALLNFNPYLPKYLVVCVKKLENVASREYCLQVRDLLRKTYEVYFVWDQYSGYHVFIIGGRTLCKQTMREAFFDRAQDFPESRHLMIAIGPEVNHSHDTARSFQAACRLLDQSQPEEGLTVLMDDDASAGLDVEATVAWLHRVFSIADAQSRRQSALEELERSFHPECSLVEQYRRLTQGLTQLYDRVLPNKQWSRSLLLSYFLQITSFRNKQEYLEAALAAMDYCYLQYQHDMNELTPVIHMAIDYVNHHYGEFISIKDFCTRNKVSTPYFGHLFKQETGVFFNNYLMQYRICAATELLRHTNLKIYEIAAKVGFSSASYFISCFRKQTGMSPIKYRMQ